MKSAAHRDLVVAKVNEEFARFRSFSDLPVVRSEAENRRVEILNITEGSAYVAALFELFDLDPSLSLRGREGNWIVAG